MSATASSVLETIVASTRRSLDARRVGVPDEGLRERARLARRPRGDLFRAALEAPGPRIIAECKRRSPSRGVLREPFDPVAIARAYEHAGAAAISVLTEPAFFDGHLEHLARVRDSVAVPLLRKDFIVDPYQLDEAVVYGADAVLLIVAALDDEALGRLHAEARSRGLEVLVEVHDEAELDRAIAARAEVIGVNNRNLRTLVVDVEASHRLVARMPDACVCVAESGLRSAADIVSLSREGFDAFLIGERFMTQADPGLALARLIADATRLAGGRW